MAKKTNERIKKLRKEARITQEEMGAMLGMKRSTYAHTEAYGHFKDEHLRIIALTFNRTVDELIEGDNYVTRLAVEKANIQTNVQRFNQEHFELEVSSDILESVITNNERKLINLYRTLLPENKEIVLKLMEKLSTDE